MQHVGGETPSALCITALICDRHLVRIGLKYSTPMQVVTRVSLYSTPASPDYTAHFTECTSKLCRHLVHAERHTLAGFWAGFQWNGTPRLLSMSRYSLRACSRLSGGIHFSEAAP